MRGTIVRTELKSGRLSWGYIVDAGRDENGKRRQIMRKGFATKKEADSALQDEIGDRKKGVDIKKDSRSFEAFFQDVAGAARGRALGEDDRRDE